MKYKLLLPIILLLLIAGIFFLKFISEPFVNSDTIIGRISNLLNRNNKIELTCMGIEKSEIDVSWNAERLKNILVIRKGALAGKIGHEYGPNRFKIKLANGIEFNTGHFKFNNWHSHIYKIEIKKDISGYSVGFEANGPDYVRSEQHFDLKGVPDGEVVEYNNKHFESFKGNYKKGLKQGQFVYFYRSGKVERTADYINDTIDGFITRYNENANIIRKTKYVKGLENKDPE